MFNKTVALSLLDLNHDEIPRKLPTHLWNSILQNGDKLKDYSSSLIRSPSMDSSTQLSPI